MHGMPREEIPPSLLTPKRPRHHEIELMDREAGKLPRTEPKQAIGDRFRVVQPGVEFVYDPDA